jgi:CPA2 family monovalent cation:H+ antiporter-2
VVRAHADGEVDYLERQGVGMAVMGERELALGMMDYALRSLGLPQDKARLVVQGFRMSAETTHWKQGLREPRREGTTGDGQVSSREEGD